MEYANIKSVSPVVSTLGRLLADANLPITGGQERYSLPTGASIKCNLAQVAPISG